jgi:phosphoribosyl-dephospho-CoA transferase
MAATSPPLHRQQLVRLLPAAWGALLSCSADPLLTEWAKHAWPLIVRRRSPGESGGVPVGVPLPPSLGKRRVALLVETTDIASVGLLPKPSDVMCAAPREWYPTLQRLDDLARKYRVRAGVAGSLGWQYLTGLQYLSPASDIDVIWSLPSRHEIKEFLTALADIDASAPMRLDGELQREDGSGANWREVNCGTATIAVKTPEEVSLWAADAFVARPGRT